MKPEHITIRIPADLELSQLVHVFRRLGCEPDNQGSADRYALTFSRRHVSEPAQCSAPGCLRDAAVRWEPGGHGYCADHAWQSREQAL